ncbi:hypothetical protein SISSUDRAFT_932160 [Sistotremastrum suecicum HHB10207 ss-3]|uniref:RNase III domain-containing protein n=1 Tax=Sistotremastrum suecicum HHB10207 ss-3 TaxID=1314776 RepID=A0A166BRC7_9AGAM|nr:hypothetical protein SISSUDRAFT_932160 [Sistotremastrum suecicum HHB10207 ss-3]
MAGRSIKTDLPSPQEIQESESGGQNSKKPHINPALDEATQRLILDMDLPAGFAERITSLPHEFLLVVFNCQPTSRAEKEKIPEDFHLRCREFGHSQATGSNKLLELLGDRALGLIVAGWLQTQCTTTKQLKDASRRLTRNRILAALALRLRLLEYPDLCMGRHDQWQTHRWVKEVFVKKILSGILPKVLANLVEALLGAHWLCGGHQQLKELLEMLLPHLASILCTRKRPRSWRKRSTICMTMQGNVELLKITKPPLHSGVEISELR